MLGNHSHYETTVRALDGKLDGFFVMGQNPAVGSANARHAAPRAGQARSGWWCATWPSWRRPRSGATRPRCESGELKPEDIQTEVFLMPAASHVEKEGHFTNTQRLLQWRDKALDPPGEARSELHFMHHLAKRVLAHYADSEDPKDLAAAPPALALRGARAPRSDPDAEEVLREINGYDVESGQNLSGFAELANDGSTACGCWIYSGCFADGVNQPRRRDPGDIDDPEGGWVSPEWGWAWPANRRLLYCRASADPEGKPWSERKKYVWWDEEQGKWTGYDVPDFPADKRPDYRAPDDARGMDAISGDDPFIMMADGRALAVHAQRAAGRTDAHPLRAGRVARGQPALPQACRPTRSRCAGTAPRTRVVPPGDGPYPMVATTFRLTEHHTAGADEPQPALAGRAPARRCSWRSSPSWRQRRASRTVTG